MNPHQGAEAQAGMSLELAGWWIFRGQKQWDPSPWVLAQARFTLIRSPGSRLSLGLRNRSGMTKCCRLVGIPCNYSLSTAAYWHLQFTRPGGLLMTAALSKFPGMVISEISSKNNQFSRSQLQQVYFPYILEGKKKKNTKPAQQRMLSSVQSLSSVWLFVTQGLQHARLPCPSPTPRACSNSSPLSRWCHPTISSSVSIPNHYRNANQKENEVLPPTGHSGHHHKAYKQKMQGRAWRKGKRPVLFGGM